MNEASTKAASKDDAEGVHRLRDIVVEEVSLVDRAANQRRFLVVKRSPDMADETKTTADTKPDSPNAIAKAKKKPAEGDTVDEEKAKKKPADDAAEGDTVDEEKAQGANAKDDEEDDAPAGEKKKQRKQDELVLDPAMKEALLRVLTDALERLMALANSIKEAAEPDEGDDGEMPDDVTTELEAIAEMLSGVDKRKRAKAGVAKAGARMAKDRLDRFQKALSLLADILKELTDSKDGAQPAPTAGAAESGVKKRDLEPAIIPGLTELASGIGELTRVVKRQEEELSRMRQARGVSNAIPVEGGRRAEHQDVSWPLDMNRPISRDKVKKEVSFFDE